MKGSPLRKLSRDVPVFLVGASAGALLTWLFSLRRSRARSAPETGSASEEPAPTRGHWSESLGEGAEERRGIRERKVREAQRVDLDALQKELGSVPGSEQIHLRDMGGGIVEALGTAPDADTVQRVLSVLRERAGVSVVVNRIWTPSSAAERKADLARTPPDRHGSGTN